MTTAMAAAAAMILAAKPPRFPFILLIGFDQKASIKIGENPNLERKKRESGPTSMEVRRNVAAPLPAFPLGANSRGGKGGDGLGFGQEQRWGGHHTEGRKEAVHKGRMIGRGWLLSIPLKGENLVHSTTENKQVIQDSSILRIERVSIKMDAFQRDFRIRGLRSTIGATVQKVKFWSTPEPLSNIFYYILPPPP
jgi:hypothetical protein